MTSSVVRQAVSFAAAMLILLAYVGHQMNWMNSRRISYNLLNAIGSAILAYMAFHPFQLGFVVLETVWALMSVYALLRTGKQG